MTDLERRAVVAFAPVGETFWSGFGPVGMLRYRAAGVPAFAVAVRVTSPFPEPGEPFLPGEPLTTSGSVSPRGAFAPLMARELVPFKEDCDVGLCGTLKGQGRRDLAASVTMGAQVGDVRRELSMLLSGEKVALGEVTATAFGGKETLLGPRSIDPIDDHQHFRLDRDADKFHTAGAPLRFPYPKAGSRIAVESDFFTIDTILGFEVFVRIDYIDGTVSLPNTHCDSVTFELDRREVDWVFRAVAVDPSEGREIERIVVCAFAIGQDEERSRVDAWLPHAVFEYASGPVQVREQKHPAPLDEEDLAMARYSTWDTPHFASTLPIEEVAQIQVELLRKKDKRAVLDAHGLSDYQWGLEERAAMDRLSAAGLSAIDDNGADESKGESEDLARYQKAHAKAMAEIPYEGREWTIARYAELRAALETRNPIRVLEKAELGPSEVVGLDFVMAARLEANAAERTEYEECFQRALLRNQEEAEAEDDFLPPPDEDDDDEEDDEAQRTGGES